MHFSTSVLGTDLACTVESSFATREEAEAERRQLQPLLRFPEEGMLQPIEEALRIVKAKEKKVFSTLLRVSKILRTGTVEQYPEMVGALQKEATSLRTRVELNCYNHF